MYNPFNVNKEFNELSEAFHAEGPLDKTVTKPLIKKIIVKKLVSGAIVGIALGLVLGTLNVIKENASNLN